MRYSPGCATCCPALRLKNLNARVALTDSERTHDLGFVLMGSYWGALVTAGSWPTYGLDSVPGDPCGIGFGALYLVPTVPPTGIGFMSIGLSYVCNASEKTWVLSYTWPQVRGRLPDTCATVDRPTGYSPLGNPLPKSLTATAPMNGCDPVVIFTFPDTIPEGYPIPFGGGEVVAVFDQ